MKLHLMIKKQTKICSLFCAEFKISDKKLKKKACELFVYVTCDKNYKEINKVIIFRSIIKI